MQKIESSLVVTSDIHLLEEDDSRGQLLQSLIKAIDPDKVECLVLTGDIFDFCFGATKYFKNKYRNIGKKLTQLSEKGVRVIFFQGNHEFSIADLKWPGVEFISGVDIQLKLKDGSSFAFTHGDRLLAPWHYHIYITINRSWIFKSIARLVPEKQLDQFALWISSLSRSQEDNRTLDHSKVLSAAEKWLNKTDCQYGIFGHFHHPYMDETSDKKRKLISVKCWDEPNILTYNNGSFNRVYF